MNTGPAATPRFSIVRRLTLLVVIGSLLWLLQSAWVTHRLLQPVGDEMATGIAQHLTAARDVLRALPEDQREAIAGSLGGGRLELAPDDPADPRGEDLTRHFGRFPPPMMRTLVEAVPADITLAWNPPPEPGARPDPGVPPGWPPDTLVRARFEVDGQLWRADVIGEPPSPLTPLLSMLGVFTLLGGGAALAMAMGVRWITRPLARMAEAMARQDGRIEPIHDDPATGRELQQVVHAFNTMVEAVRRQERGRRDLLAGLSHDLRTPLTRLRLRAECEAEPATYAAMTRDFDALAHIIRQFLAYAQGDGAAALGRLRPIDELVRDSTAPLADRDTGTEVRVEIVGGGWSDWRLPDVEIGRVLDNLIGNAIDHGRSPVTVRLAPVGIDPSTCLLSVHDGGPGIPAETFDQALQPFVRLGADAGQIGHCGLGLAIVQRLATQLGGRVIRLGPESPNGWGVGVVLMKDR
ncbi:ATP-binding protein [Leptothrix sp. BB-4]